MSIAAYGRPADGEYPPFFETYLGHVPEADPIAVLSSQIDVVKSFVLRVTQERYL